MINKTLAHYRIIEMLGEGGMGEVYRAEDTKLDRHVAIKVLPDVFAKDEERLARFEREAKVLASLNHPNIAAIYGLEEAEDKRFLVMELVEGDTLEQRLGKRALSIEEALELCLQIGEAVEAAHEKDLIHRDLKPANVKITPEGRVKVLDFGLAKALVEEEVGPDLSKSPTITAQMTQPGVILGTAPYMSPEQARGKPLDKRTDIWAFGCILYEMLSGERAFGADLSADQTVSDLIASVLAREPVYDKLPEDTPLTIKRLLRRCLQKDLSHRLRDIGDAAIELRESLKPADDFESQQIPKKRRRIPAAAYILIGILIGVAAGILFLSRWGSKPSSAEDHISKFSLQLSEHAPFVMDWTPGNGLAISPDGSKVVFTAGFNWAATSLYSRSLNSLEIKEIEETRGAVNPFFSPDSKSIGFFNINEDALKKMPTDGGQPVTLVPDFPIGIFASAFWSKDGSIIFSGPGTPVQRISGEGGEVEILFTPQERFLLTTAQLLPNSQALLCTEWEHMRPTISRVMIFDLKTGDSELILENAAFGKYLESGHILFTRDRILFAAPFDLERLEVSGPIKPIELAIKTGYLMAAFPQFQFVVSSAGTLVYAPSSTRVRKESALVWLNQNGENLERMIHPILYPYISISPEGKKIALSALSGTGGRLHVFDPDRGGLRQVEDGIIHSMPIWSPDGTQIVFRSSKPEPGLYSKDIESNSPPILIHKDPDARTVFSWSADGRNLAYTRVIPGGRQEDIWILPMDPPGEAWPFLEKVEREDMPAFSPDGKWLAYASEKVEGVVNVFVQRFPEGGNETPISEVGGKAPIWSADGKQIFYTSVSGKTVYKVPFESHPQLMVGRPQVVFEGEFLYSVEDGRSYAFSPHTKRFLMVEDDEPRISPNLVVVLNWFEELKRLWPEDN